MGENDTRNLIRDEGQASVTYLLAIGVSLVIFVMLANLMMFLYARGVIRAAVDEGARAGAVANRSSVECLQRANDALGDLLGGSLGREVEIGCEVDGDDMVAIATATLSSPFVGLADWTFVSEARATDESSLLP